jgi:chromosome segregation ATPase
MSRKQQPGQGGKDSSGFTTITVAVIGGVCGLLGAVAGAGATMHKTQKDFELRVIEITGERDKAKEQRREAKEQADRSAAELRAARQQLAQIAKRYTGRIDQLMPSVVREIERREGPTELVPVAQALVDARKAYRDQLDSLRANLNSEFDALETLVGLPAADTTRNEALRRSLIRLRNAWPAKKDAIESAAAKVCAAT